MVDKSRNKNRVRAVEGMAGEDMDGDGHADCDNTDDGGCIHEGIFDA